MGYARYVGRVGALAMALGIGVAVANGPAIAWADGDEGSSSGSTAGTSSGATGASTGPTGTSSGGTTDAPSGSPGETSPSDPSGAAEEDGSESEGEETTVEEPAAGDGDEGKDEENASVDGDADSPQPKGGSSTKGESVPAAPAGDSRRLTRTAKRSDVDVTSTASASTTVSSSTTTGGVDPDPVTTSVAVEMLSEPSAYRTTVTTADVREPVTVSDDAPLTQAAAETITGLFSWLALNPFIDGGPADAPDSPFAWAILAALRRLTEEDSGTEQRLMSVADPVGNTLIAEGATPVYQLDSSIPVGSGPSGLAVTPDGSHVYVVDRFTKSVSVVDTSTRTIVATIPMGAGPNAVAFSPDGSRAYVGLHGVNRVAVIDTATNTVVDSVKVGPGATEIAVTPDGSRAYVTNTSGRTVSVIDTATNTEISRVSVGSSPMGLAVTPDGSQVYVANRYSNSVSVIDTATNKVVRTVKVGSSPRSVTVGLDGSRAYVTNAGPDTVSVIDTSTNTVVATVRVGRDPIGVAMSPDKSLVYTANSNDSVSVIDVATNSVVQTFAVDAKPETGVHYIAVGPDGTVYVTDTRDKTLRVVTVTSTVAETSTFSVQGGSAPMMFATVAAVNTAPTTSPTSGAPDTATGKVTGALNAVDAEGNPLTYTVRSKTAGAAVTVNGSGNFTYTPSAAMRAQAATTSNLDTDTFTVRVSDGQTFTDVPVTVTVRPSQLVGAAPVDVGRDPSGIAVNATGSRAYVTNQYDKTVSVVDTSTGAVLSTIKVRYSPKAVVVSPVAGQNRAYVAMTSGVAVIDTLNNKVVDINPATTTVDSIRVGASPSAIAINPTGTRLYVSNGGSSTVSVIDTATNKEITRVSVGSQPSGLAVSPDGTRVYALSRYSDRVTVFRTDTNQVIGSAAVGDSPREIVLSRNGQTAYVTNYNSGTVTVLNTAATTPTLVKTITVGTQPQGIAMSKDGTLVYVANGRDTVSVIDTRTNAVVGSAVAVDSPAESGAHTIAVAGNKVFVTDYVDDWVRVLNVAPLQTPPQAAGPPTVGTPDEATGTVTGDLKVIDTDGDALSYTVIDAPDKGTLTVNPNGSYSYTPTAAARHAAEANSTDTFAVRVSDRLGAFTDVSVTVPVLPNPAPPLGSTTTPIGVGYPTGVVVVGNRAYAVNGYGSVSVIDTATNQVVGNPIAVGYAPTRIVAGPDLDPRPEVTNVKRIYVATFATVSVIDTDPTSATYNTVIADIAVPFTCEECYNGVYDVVVKPDGTRIYAARGDGSISVIGTDPSQSGTYHQVISTAFPGSWDGDFEITPDGSRIYLAHISTDEVVVLDSETLAQVARVPVGPRWDLDSMRSEMTDSTFNIAISPDGTRAYVTERIFIVERGVGGSTSGYFISDPMGRTWKVTGGHSAVSVIDTDPASSTYNQEIARIVVDDAPYDVSLDSEANRAYVTHLDGRTVTVIDTETNTVLGVYRTDQSGGSYIFRTVAVGPDGTVYVTDTEDNTVYASTVGNTPSAM